MEGDPSPGGDSGCLAEYYEDPNQDSGEDAYAQNWDEENPGGDHGPEVDWIGGEDYPWETWDDDGHDCGAEDYDVETWDEDW